MNKSRELLLKDQVVLDTKTKDSWFFTVKEKYSVIISTRGCSCSCEYSSLWGMKDKKLFCKHIWAALAACMLRVRRNDKPNTKI